MEAISQRIESMDPKDALEFMKTNADKILEREYPIYLTDKSRDHYRSVVVEDQDELDTLKDKLKEITKSYKDQIKGLESERKKASKILKQGFVLENGPVFTFVDRNEKLVYDYNADGILLEKRTASLREIQQTSILDIHK